MLRPRGVGGVGSVVDTVSPHLGDAARVLTVSARCPRDLARIAIAARGRVVHLHSSLRLRALLRDGVLHRLLRARGARTVVHWHGLDRTLLRRLDRRPGIRWRVRGGFGDAARTFVLVPELADRLRRWGWHGVELVRNPAPVSERAWTPEPHRLLFLGRLVADKGIASLGVAFALLRRRWPDTTLALAGSGPCTLDGPGVERLGWLDPDTRARELARASVLVLPTRDDAAPMAVLEALGAGVPVVATRIGAIPEMVGDHGVVVDRPDPASIARAVERVWADPPRSRRDFDAQTPRAIAAQWVATYRAIACTAG
ncbi:MAG: glycosyltransferase family 4 protein [Myxococcota bacterium]